MSRSDNTANARESKAGIPGQDRRGSGPSAETESAAEPTGADLLARYNELISSTPPGGTAGDSTYLVRQLVDLRKQFRAAGLPFPAPASIRDVSRAAQIAEEIEYAAQHKYDHWRSRNHFIIPNDYDSQGASRGSPSSLSGIWAEDRYNPEHYRQVYSAQHEGRRLIEAQSWTAPDTGLSIAEARRSPPPPVKHVIQGILPEGVSILSAQFKAGKTTLGIDMGACLASGQKFLDYFPAADVGNVGYWNLEVDESQMYDWIDRRIARSTRRIGRGTRTERCGEDRFFAAHLRGQNINLLLEPVREWAVKWLRDREVSVWFIDPQSRMVTNENDAAEYTEWFRAVEQVVREAQVRGTLIMHHAGHPAAGNSDAIPRSRGTSAMQGNPDGLLAYRHGGDLGSFPPDSLRYLSGFGRGVDLSELTLDYKADTGQLYVVSDSPSQRDSDKMDSRARKAAEALALELTDSGDTELNAGEFDRLITGSKSEKVAVRVTAVRAGYVVARAGSGHTKFYSPGEVLWVCRYVGTVSVRCRYVPAGN